jgi:ribose transport system ATP-binding protein
MADTMVHEPETKAAPEEAPPTLRMEHISKSFGATRALDDVSIAIRPGEVHGLLGTNGSGKSTLIKVLAGFHAPDPGGRMQFNGQEVALPLQSSDFRRLGMSFVHQNLGLIPSLTVLENLRLAHISLARRYFIRWRDEVAAAEEALARHDLKIETWRRVDELSAVNRALLAIVRAFEEIREQSEGTGQPGLVLLDEPTPFLPKEGVDQLFDLMRRIARSGSSVAFISHDIGEVMTITDRVTILRDGKVSGEIETRSASHDQVVEMIIGRSLARTAAQSAPPFATEFAPFATIRGLAGQGNPSCNLEIGKGEIVGLTGLIGSGYEKLPYMLFGASKPQSGTMELADGVTLDLTRMTPAKAIAAGLALLPGDRETQSGVGSIPIFENMLLPGLDEYFRKFLLRNSEMKREAGRLGELFEVRPNNPEMNLAALSGGNAQKVLVARWMKRAPRLLLLDEPTQGVDVGTRANLFEAFRLAAGEGMSIICASSDAEQLAEICDRVLVFARGRVVREMTGSEIDADMITEACYTSLDVGAARSTPSQETLQ